MNEKLKINNLFVRFEPNINNGTLFLFNKDNGKIYEGNESTWEIIKRINISSSISDIASDIAVCYEQNESEILLLVTDVVNELVEKGFISVYNE